MCKIIIIIMYIRLRHFDDGRAHGLPAHCDQQEDDQIGHAAGRTTLFAPVSKEMETTAKMPVTTTYS